MFTSDVQNSESLIDDLSSLGQDLISTMIGEKYDSVRECLESEQVEKPQKYCSLAQFVEGNDIARRSFKRQARNSTVIDKEVNLLYITMKILENVLRNPSFKFNVIEIFVLPSSRIKQSIK